MPVQTQMQVRRGTASSWTSTNPTLAAGELGFETDTGKFKIGTGSSTWTALPYAGGGQNTLTTYQYTATAGQTTFSGADINSNTLSYTAGAVQVYLNGALLQNTVDYAASTGTSVVLTAGAGLGDSLTILSLGSFTVSTDIPKSTLTAKGSIIAASGAATPANLSVGANDTVLTADSSTATGLKWATPAAGGMTLLSTTTLSGASTTISSIDQGYVDLVVFVFGVTNATDAGRFKCLPNASGSITTTFQNADTTTVTTQINEFIWLTSTNYNASRTSADNFRTVTISNYSSTTARKGVTVAGGYVKDGGGNYPIFGSGYINTNSAITSLVFSVTDTGGNFSTGTVLVYGVK